MAVTGHALNQLLQQMDRTFSNVTGQSVSFIDQEGHYQGPLRLDVFTGFCRRVISSEKGAQHCLACNHSFGLDAEQRCTVSQCHMGISVISVPVPLPETCSPSRRHRGCMSRRPRCRRPKSHPPRRGG